MRPFTTLYRRFSWLVHELAKFGTVGALAYVVQIAVTNLYWYAYAGDRQDVLAVLIGQTVGTVCATVVAFLGNRFWTFRHRARSGLLREYALFFALNGVGLLIQLACVWATVSLLGLDGPLARNIAGNVVGVGLGSLFRFWSYRKWVFRTPESHDAGAADRPPVRADQE
ncbi:GtrA family protein [Nocardiopsis ansamitocini]|uniref:Membrane protein n=1 Tax=Nocardiopsis ansamitocini TaxID=1670832 RepID=A0A9W6UKH3_9ACTN|nr:GtrA family protein [Nocardiopsis ansamitocini]GLU49593.1 membrane protein [Nocardiopsis ansamitocini]